MPKTDEYPSTEEKMLCFQFFSYVCWPNSRLDDSQMGLNEIMKIGMPQPNYHVRVTVYLTD